MDGISLVSGSDDGSVRVWDTKTCQVVHVFKQVKSPINNVLVLKQPSSLNPQPLSKAQGSVFRKHAPSLLPPPLDKYINSMDVNVDTRPLKTIKFPRDELDYQYISAHVMMNQMKELQQQGSSASSEVELERLRLDCKRSLQMVQQWKKMYQDLLHISMNESLTGNQSGNTTENS